MEERGDWSGLEGQPYFFQCKILFILQHILISEMALHHPRVAGIFLACFTVHALFSLHLLSLRSALLLHASSKVEMTVVTQ
ncbi:unnamed protein product [Rangifer tarandus platyrhynchus]|uniref:Uncharacterized protein n=1 Tax=Rangifer tarandus platyrhynchus TaxID=3082113 RepID=A0AC59YF08_RANTA